MYSSSYSYNAVYLSLGAQWTQTALWQIVGCLNVFLEEKTGTEVATLPLSFSSDTIPRFLIAAISGGTEIVSRTSMTLNEFITHSRGFMGRQGWCICIFSMSVFPSFKYLLYNISNFLPIVFIFAIPHLHKRYMYNRENMPDKKK